MNAPPVTVAQQLRQDLQQAFEPITTQHPAPQTGFSPAEAPVDAPAAPTAPSEQSGGVKPPSEPVQDPRMARVIEAARKNQAEKAAIAAERAQMKADLDELARYREMKARAKEDPVAWAEEGGFKPDEYATTLMEKGSLTPERRRLLEQQREINELREWREQFQQQQQLAQGKQLYNTVRQEMEGFASQAGETYDLVHRTKSYDDVLRVIQKHYEETSALGEPEIMAYEDAFAQVEQDLEARYAPVLESPKLRSRLGAPAPSAPQSPTALRKPQGTINKNMRAAQSVPPTKTRTEAEMFQQAGEHLWAQIYGRRG